MEEEFLVLYKEYQPANMNFRHSLYGEFDLDDMENDECLELESLEFGVRKRDLATLAEALEIPESFHCQQRSKINGMEELCILLKWFAYPCRYSDMTDMLPLFGRSVPVLGMATDTVLD